MQDENAYIEIVKASVHNLKDISLRIPRNQLIVVTGLSGSGKSSLAFDTIFAEAQRRYVDTLSAYAKQFIGVLERPKIERISGLSPTIAIEQKSTNRNPRSTVGTITEISDFLRLLYARVGVPHCPVCGKEISQQTLDQIVDRILKLDEGTRFMVLSPVVKAQKGMHEKVFADARRSGFARVRVDGNMYDLSEKIELDKNIDCIICWELTRIARRADVIYNIRDFLLSKKIRWIVVKPSFTELIDNSGSTTPMMTLSSKVTSWVCTSTLTTPIT